MLKEQVVGVLRRSVGSVGRASATALLICAAVVGALVASAHLASGARPPVSHFAVLSDHPVRVRAHVADAVGAPSGAVAAATVGLSSVYVWQRPPEELCVVDIQEGVQGGASCAAVSYATRAGLVVILEPIKGSTPSVAVLVPNGVSSVTVTDLDGVSHAVAVSNNVAVVEDAQAQTVHYEVGGASQSMRVQ